MKRDLREYFYKRFELPYLLCVTSDSGQGQPVIFLHGIASNSSTWRNVLPLLESKPFRLITIDLLGFGDSPNPVWPNFTLQDHARSVARTIRRLGLSQQPIVVGHSMGSLIATELATAYPKLVKRLVLCSIPLYAEKDLNETVSAHRASGRNLNNAYFKLYEKLMNNKEFTLSGAQRIDALSKADDLDLTTANWNSFTKSLENSIIKQQTFKQLEVLHIPINIIYGKLDVLLISKYFKVLGTVNKHIKVTAVPAGHGITLRYAQTIAKKLTTFEDA